MCEKLSSSSASSIDNDSCAKYRVFMDLEAAASQCAVLGTAVPAENEKSPAPWGNVQIRTLKLNAQMLESGGRLPSSLQGQSDIIKKAFRKDRTAYHSLIKGKQEQPQVSFQHCSQTESYRLVAMEPHIRFTLNSEVVMSFFTYKILRRRKSVRPD